MRGTNHNFAAGRRTVRLPAGLSAVVAETCARASRATLRVFDQSPAGEAQRQVSGTETREWLARVARDQEAAALARQMQSLAPQTNSGTPP